MSPPIQKMITDTVYFTLTERLDSKLQLMLYKKNITIVYQITND